MINQLSIKGVKLIKFFSQKDLRGNFKKTFAPSYLNEYNINFDIKQSLITLSKKNVLRGMHFQLPPYDQDKIVSCINGEVLDVFIDLRKNSETFKKVNAIHLSEVEPMSLFLPSGIAHGFLTLSDQSLMQYFLNSDYHPDYDKGVLWNSIKFDWMTTSPILSDRDKSHTPLSEFISPF